MRWLWGMLACVVCVAPVRAGSGLELVPADAFGFVHLRVGELWQSDSMKDVRNVLQKAGPEALQAFDSRFLPTPSSIHELTIILLVKPMTKEPPMPLFVVSTKKAIDRKEMIQSSFADAKPVPGKTGYYSDSFGENALFFIEDSSFAFGSKEACDEYLSRKPAKSGPLAPAISFAATKHLVIAFNPSVIPVSEIGDLGPFAPLVKANSAMIAMNVQKNAVLDVRLTFPNATAAQEGEQAVRMLLQFARQGLQQAKSEMQRQVLGEPNRKGRSNIEEMPQAAAALFGLGMIGYYEEIIATLPLKRTGSDLSVSLSLPEGPYTSMVAVSGLGVGLLLPAVQKVREAAGRTKDANNLKQIALALHNYHDTYNGFPPAAICDKRGKPLLSWRVAILPYIEQENLYRQFKLDEPWDSEHNIKLLDRIPMVYLSPGSKDQGTNKTHYRVAIGNPGKKGDNFHTMFDLIRGRGITSITDGTSNTAMVLTAEEAVPWSKPDELFCEAGKPLPKLATFFSGGSNVAFGDGSVRFLRMPLDEETLRRLLAADDGQVLNLP